MKSTSLWLGRTLLVFLLAPLVVGMGFDERTFECENAVAHLAECCSSFTAAASLCPQPFGCGGEPSLELSSAESACIKGKDCSDVRSRGLCSKAAALVEQAKPTIPAGSKADVARRKVCP